ncbi:aminotransferase class I/II-fold pyridoxal phosphate-dependent enzyme [Ancylobacter sp. Lp-2]|uniref:aminotransferase class I/II-fold pyridoxal phosphate-dependent enzyme n=1 Tax=Ancylobacter sp. Lp-2 TaxID=2881339 RepID=UPI001E30AF74|nr:aminotransferase class I/II-fold pyridoxal phosphate-dependent enzyme [Ancylobacter sp. Lp-2]MCB4767058.1 aminotransferase class I/II-fold pyridoxal phosphate-dependent enzyme [Ancylobacter sp. Lp-2]
MVDKRTYCLTMAEDFALDHTFSLADGHAYHDPDEEQQKVIDRLSSLWSTSKNSKHSSIELDFVNAFYTLAEQRSQIDNTFFRLCTSASQSIDMVAAWLSRNSLTLGLIEPTFDNLSQIMQRWSVHTTPINEDLLYHDEFTSNFDRLEVDAILIVCPNNPTGRYPNFAFYERLAVWARKNSKVLIFDFCFRFFAPPVGDVFQLLRDAGVSYIAIEDTGKTWPTLDMKVSVLTYSKNLSNELENIYAEIILHISPFTTMVAGEFVKSTLNSGLSDGLWRLVRQRRSRLRSSLDKSIFSVPDSSVDNILPVDWIEIADPSVCDVDVVDLLMKSRVGCLPGRYFYWRNRELGKRYVRFSLLKSDKVFRTACDILSTVRI